MFSHIVASAKIHRYAQVHTLTSSISVASFSLSLAISTFFLKKQCLYEAVVAVWILRKGKLEPESTLKETSLNLQNNIEDSWFSMHWHVRKKNKAKIILKNILTQV